MLKRGIAFLVFWPVHVVPTNGVPKFAVVVGVLESNGAVDESVHAPRFDEPKLRSKCVARASNSGFGACVLVIELGCQPKRRPCRSVTGKSNDLVGAVHHDDGE